MRGSVDKMWRMSGKLRTGLLLLIAAALPSCTFISGRTDVLITSTPAGAAVFLDGHDTGETTPIHIDVGDYAFFAGYLGSDHEITIRKPGFEAERRRIYHHTAHYTSAWVDGITDWLVLPLPLYWTTGDWFTPFGIKWDFVPHELHVKLYPIGEAPGKHP